MKRLTYKALNKISYVTHHAARRFSPVDVQAERVKPWFADNGDQTLRVNYDLDQNSVVFDFGGYEGEWASDIYGMYRSKLYVFEPLESYFTNIQTRFKHNPDIQVFPYGLSDKDTTIRLSIEENASSAYKESGQMVEAKLRKASDFFVSHKIDHVDLMKLNIEGGEYDLLDHIIATGFVKQITDIQVQFHDFVPNAEERMERIQKELAKTHKLTYQYPFVWENWRRK